MPHLLATVLGLAALMHASAAFQLLEYARVVYLIYVFMNLDARNRVDDDAICQKCGHIHRFVDPAALVWTLGGGEEEAAVGQNRLA